MPNIAHNPENVESNPFSNGLRGEWWIDDSGGATFADGDVGDQNHETIAFWSALGVDPDEAFSLGEILPNEGLSEEQASGLLEMGAEPKAVEFFSGDGGDARDYMMVERAWIRVADNNFQLWNLDDEALGRIRDFINNEYPEDEDPLEDEFQIEELRKDGVHLSVSGADLIESGKSADALKYSAQRERTGMYNPKVSNPPSSGLNPHIETFDLAGPGMKAVVDKNLELYAWHVDALGKPLHQEVLGRNDVATVVVSDQFVGIEVSKKASVDDVVPAVARQIYVNDPNVVVEVTQRNPIRGDYTEEFSLSDIQKRFGVKIDVVESNPRNPQTSERTYYEIGHRGLKSKLWYGDEFNITVEPAVFDIDDKYDFRDPRNLHNEWALRMPWHGRYDPYSGEVSIMGGMKTEGWRQPSEWMLDRLRETFGADVQIVQFNPGAYNPRRGFR
jgi:hypothetical protein